MPGLVADAPVLHGDRIDRNFQEQSEAKYRGAIERIVAAQQRELDIGVLIEVEDNAFVRLAEMGDRQIGVFRKPVRSSSRI